MNNTKLISQIAIGSAVAALLALASLHFLSADIAPSWHMISEYAYGSYGWILSLFFFLWAISYWASGVALMPYAKSWITRICVFLLLVSGFGALMGGLFDVRHSLHGMAFALGVPFLPFVAPIVMWRLHKKYKAGNTYSLLLTHAVWVSFILMAVSMGIFMSQMIKSGAMNMTTPQYLSTLPEGITPIIGYTNRFLVASYIGWLIAINYIILKISNKKK